MNSKEIDRNGFHKWTIGCIGWIDNLMKHIQYYIFQKEILKTEWGSINNIKRGINRLSGLVQQT